MDPEKIRQIYNFRKYDATLYELPTMPSQNCITPGLNPTQLYSLYRPLHFSPSETYLSDGKKEVTNQIGTGEERGQVEPSSQEGFTIGDMYERILDKMNHEVYKVQTSLISEQDGSKNLKADVESEDLKAKAAASDSEVAAAATSNAAATAPSGEQKTEVKTAKKRKLPWFKTWDPKKPVTFYEI